MPPRKSSDLPLRWYTSDTVDTDPNLGKIVIECDTLRHALFRCFKGGEYRNYNQMIPLFLPIVTPSREQCQGLFFAGEVRNHGQCAHKSIANIIVNIIIYSVYKSEK